jgi:hypothetical protein
LNLQATFENFPDPAFGWVFGIILDRLVKIMYIDDSPGPFSLMVLVANWTQARLLIDSM